MSAFSLDSAEALTVTDEELQQLLSTVYVEGGYTDPQRAVSMFAGPAVRARGQLLCARHQPDGALAGSVIVVFPGSAARRLAQGDECEMHLLAVHPSYRRHGLGRRLVHAALERMAAAGYRQMLLYTQTSMHPAHRLYTTCGFSPVPTRDFRQNDRDYRVFEKTLTP